MEARAAKCALTLHSPALQNPPTGWITLTRTNFGSVCLCQHGPLATARCCSQSCVKWKNPVSSRAMGSLSLLRRIDSLFYLLFYEAENKIHLTWTTQNAKTSRKAFSLFLVRKLQSEWKRLLTIILKCSAVCETSGSLSFDSVFAPLTLHGMQECL